MEKTNRIKLTRPAPSQGGFASARNQYKVSEWPASDPLPRGAVRVADDTEVSTTWKYGEGPAELAEATEAAEAEAPATEGN